MLAGLNKLIDWWGGLSEKMQTFIVVAPMVAGGISAIVIAIGGAILAFQILNPLLLGTPVGWVILALSLLAVALAATVIWWDELTAGVKKTWTALDNIPLLSNVKKALGTLSDIAIILVDKILAIGDAFETSDKKSASAFAGMENGVLRGTQNDLTTFFSWVNSQWKNLMTTIETSSRDFFENWFSKDQASGIAKRFVQTVKEILLDLVKMIPGLAPFVDIYKLSRTDLSAEAAQSSANLKRRFGLYEDVRPNFSVDDALDQSVDPSISVRPSARQELMSPSSAHLDSSGKGAKGEHYNVKIDFNGNLIVQAQDLFAAEKASYILVREIVKGAHA